MNNLENIKNFDPKNSSGILIIDKPEGISSAKLVSIVKKTLNAKKVGHTGTLDPFATGVMICCINKATKLAGRFINGNKTYRAILKLGIETDTCDLTGKVLFDKSFKVFEISQDKINLAFKNFEGEIYQEPPFYSALKHNGSRLYELARKGEFISKPARKVNIFYNKIINIELPNVYFEVSCSSGTYIRKLASDIGAILDCGGHIISLKRIESSGFTIFQAMSLEEFKNIVLNNKILEYLKIIKN